MGVLWRGVGAELGLRLVVGGDSLCAAVDRIARERKEVPQTLAKSYFGVRAAVDFIELRVRIITGQEMVEEMSEGKLLFLRHVLHRAGGDVLWICPVHVER